ncbi:uncharacterized protein LOC135836759 [Planococcus citri]|uniref:uncharacterized protein LOC135836759 n=1 Tax=Planococcus citri TaxID=170843 RepID=UPI0031F9A748
MAIVLALSWISCFIILAQAFEHPTFNFYGTGKFGEMNATTSQSFMDLLRSDFYVDRTLIIMNVTKTYQRDVLYLVMPSKFGKTVNLDMIRTFFGMPVDKDGNPIYITETPAYKLFIHGKVELGNGQVKHLPQVLSISHYKRVMDKYMCKYPIIYVNLGHTNGSNLTEIVKLLSDRIKISFEEHPYLLASMDKKLASDIPAEDKAVITRQREIFLRIMNQKATQSDVEQSLQLITNLVHLHYGIRPYLMMDDFEGPFLNVLTNWNIGEYHTDPVLSFLYNFYAHGIQWNWQMEKGFLSGSMAAISIFKNISNYIDYKPTQHLILERYTLLHEDLLTIFKHYNVPEELQTKAINWYGGQRWSRGYRKKIYNIHAIRQFLCTGKLDYIRERHKSYDRFFEDLLRKFTRMRFFALDRLFGEVWGHIPRLAKPINYYHFLDIKNHLLNSTTPRKFTYPNIGFLTEKLILPESLEPFHAGSGLIATRFILATHFLFLRTPHNEAKMWIGDKIMQFYCKEWGLKSELIDKAVANLAEFIKDGETKPDDLIAFLKDVINNDRIMADADLYQEEEWAYRGGFGKLMNAIFNYLGLRVAMEYESLNVESVDSYDGPVASFVWHNLAIYDDKRVVFFEVHVNETATFGVGKARTEYERIAAFVDHPSQKYVGISARALGNIEILQETVEGPFTTTTARPSNRTRTTLSVAKQRKKDRMGIIFYEDIDYDPDTYVPIVTLGKFKKKAKKKRREEFF